jgi:phytoene dehydrogenase-like protein
VGLSEAIGEPGRRALEAAGVRVRAGERVERIVVEDGRAAGVALGGGEVVTADAVVSALPPRELDAALPGAHRFDRLGAAPIVNAFLWYDRAVADRPFAGTFGSPLQWVFDRERLLGSERSGGPCLGISLSAADEWIDLSKDQIAARLDEAVARVFPRRRGARLRAAAVVKEPRATFRAGPGCGRSRPGPEGPVAGLWLAGDWTDTGWPATMEGAVRSGETAAAAALAGRSAASASGSAR